MYKELVISRAAETVKEVKTITFTSESTEGIRYKAGQYLTLVKGKGEGEVRRSYSIVSSPTLNEPLSICVKRIENGVFSRLLVDEAKPGDTVLTSGTGGFLTLPDDPASYSQLIFFAGGSGIAPVISLIKTALHTAPYIGIVLIYSSRSKSDTIYLDELQSLAKRFSSSLSVEFLFSNTKHLDSARLHQQLLKKLLKKYAFASFERTLFYICGPFPYMRMITFTLIEEHVPEANIRKENFNASKPVVVNEPPDKEMRTIEMRHNGKDYSFTSQYPDTILRSAQKAGLNLPYSCEVGRCGNCAARCIKGKIWMSYNEVLTDKEVASGIVLTCTGYAVDSDAVLETVKF